MQIDELEARKIKKLFTQYIMTTEKLYKMGGATPMLRCLEKQEVCLILVEFHEGVYGSHISGRALASKLLKVEYY